MGRNDWFRRTTWSSEDQEAFWARLRRSRSSEGRAQYLRIQAWHLEAAGLVEAAMDLLATHIRDYPESLGGAQVHCQIASCRERNKDIPGALSELRIALAFQQDHPRVLTRAFFEFARLAAEHSVTQVYDEVLRYHAEHAQRAGRTGVIALFPLDKYLLSGALAVIEASRGDLPTARRLAKAALAAADDRTSPFRYHRDVGRVENTDTRIHRQVVALAADG